MTRLEISGAAYDEIRGKLETVGYDCVTATGIILLNGMGLCKNRQAEDRVHREKLDVKITVTGQPAEKKHHTPWAGYLQFRDAARAASE